MIPIFKEEVIFNEELSINNFKKIVSKSDLVDDVFQTKKSINFNLKRVVGNRGVIRLFWTKISVVCKPDKTDSKTYNIIYKIDGLSTFMLFMLLGGVMVEFTMFDTGVQERDLPPYAIPLMGFAYLGLIIVELIRVRKVVKIILY